jgi:hypothetical protein
MQNGMRSRDHLAIDLSFYRSEKSGYFGIGRGDKTGNQEVQRVETGEIY